MLTGPEEIAYEPATGAGGPRLGREPGFFAEELVGMFRMLRRGAHERTVDTVRALGGREPHGFGEFINDHAGLFRA